VSPDAAAPSAVSNVVPLQRREGTPDYAGMLAAVAAGDRQAETQLMQTLTLPLQVVLRHRARHAEGVEDLCQDALIVVLQAAREGAIGDPQALVAYALQTARQLALNAERKRERRQTVNAGDGLDESADPAGEGSDQLASEQLRSCVGTVLDSLANPRDRQLLRNYYLKETPPVDLQSQMAMDAAQFGKVLHRARQRFGRMWQALNYDVPSA
jgi:RNA polymerase sigma factor (sigma-70 family)